MKSIAFLLALAAPVFAVPTPFETTAPMVRLWPGAAPGSEGKTAPERWVEGGTPDAFHRVTDIHVPSLTVYLPPAGKANGAAFVIAPGGGHRYLVVDLEGELVAKKLNAMGVAAFVLRSRLAHAEGSTYKVEVESLADVQRALRVVRSRAKEWGVDAGRVGVMGFSAGGQLAALAENKPAAGDPSATDPIDRLSAKPNFAVLGYPGLTGWNSEIAKDAPATFMFVNDDDALATPAAEYYLALRKAKIPTEFHVFRRGGHGVGATGRAPGFEKLGSAQWPELLRIWMTDLGLMR